MVDYLNGQYDLLESGSVNSLETYQESMNRSAEDAVCTDTYMSAARAAAAAMNAEEYMDGGTVTAPVPPPMPLHPLGKAGRQSEAAVETRADGAWLRRLSWETRAG